MLHVLTNRRFVTDEIMDSPDVEEAAHLLALAGLRRINRFSGTADKMCRPIFEFARRENLKHISILDIACGGGDVPIQVAVGLQRRGIGVELKLLDRSRTAVRAAAGAARNLGIVCEGIEADVLADLRHLSDQNASPSPGPPGEGRGEGLSCPPLDPHPSPLPEYRARGQEGRRAEVQTGLKVDVVTNSLFLHHLREPEQVVGLLRRMTEIAGRMVVISDLVRSRMGLIGAWAGCRVLSRSTIVHHDGPASVRAAWTMGEIAEFARRAGMDGARIERSRPWRMLLVWEKPQGGAA